MPEHSEDFEEHVSEVSRLFLEKMVKAFRLCENGLESPQIPFPDYRFQALPALDKLLMEWERHETCAKNEGYSGWHAKYMAACCYLLQGYKESNTQTTIRTTRCAVIMINKVLSCAHEVWEDHAFSIWPALATKGYLLASVGRHAEPVRRAIVARVSETLLSEHEKPKVVDYNFNPVMLMSVLSGEGERTVAGKLNLPYLPEKKGWSWAELGLHGVHDYVARTATPLQRVPNYHFVPSSKPPQLEIGALASSSSGVVRCDMLSQYNNGSPGMHYQSFSTSPQYPPVSCAPLLPSHLNTGSRYPYECETGLFQKTEGKDSICEAPEVRDRPRYNMDPRRQCCTGARMGRPYYGQTLAENALSGKWMNQYPTVTQESCRVPTTNDSNNFMHLWPECYILPAPGHVLPTIPEGYGQLLNPDQYF
ncbi:MAG: hypothetical protein Q9217_004577 [Psora testacea]